MRGSMSLENSSFYDYRLPVIGMNLFDKAAYKVKKPSKGIESKGSARSDSLKESESEEEEVSPLVHKLDVVVKRLEVFKALY